MTVLELINKLQSVEDKNLEVAVYLDCVRGIEDIQLIDNEWQDNSDWIELVIGEEI